MVDYLDRAENEIARLHAENERLCFQREGLLCRVAELRAENERLHAKIINSGPEDDWEERGAAAELRAEIEQLKALAAELTDALENALHVGADLSLVRRARAALADQGKG